MDSHRCAYAHIFAPHIQTYIHMQKSNVNVLRKEGRREAEKYGGSIEDNGRRRKMNGTGSRGRMWTGAGPQEGEEPGALRVVLWTQLCPHLDCILTLTLEL